MKDHIAEVEVGSTANWAANHRRPYYGGRSIFMERLDEDVVIRLCEEGLG